MDDNTVLSEDFRDFISALNAHRVRYVLVGGYALGYHGVIRATVDIDFLYDRAVANVSRLCDALAEFGAPDRLIDPEFLATESAVTQVGLPPVRIDLLASVSGVDFPQVWSGATLVVIDGQRLRVIGLDELRANKAATGRKKDKEDLRALSRLGPLRSDKKRV